MRLRCAAITVMIMLVVSAVQAAAPTTAHEDATVRDRVEALHAEMGLGDDLAVDVLETALVGMCNLLGEGRIAHPSPMVVIDYTHPSTVERLFVLDLEERRVLHRSLVAHGKGSGDNEAVRFGNREGSHMSSLGFFEVGATYHGKHGYSLRLEGLEPGLNDAAEERAIVIHAADYVSFDFIRRVGRLGRSWGCPALPPDQARAIIDAMIVGSCLYIHSEAVDAPERPGLLSTNGALACLERPGHAPQSQESD